MVRWNGLADRGVDLVPCKVLCGKWSRLGDCATRSQMPGPLLVARAVQVLLEEFSSVGSPVGQGAHIHWPRAQVPGLARWRRARLASRHSRQGAHRSPRVWCLVSGVLGSVRPAVVGDLARSACWKWLPLIADTRAYRYLPDSVRKHSAVRSWPPRWCPPTHTRYSTSGMPMPSRTPCHAVPPRQTGRHERDGGSGGAPAARPPASHPSSPLRADGSPAAASLSRQWARLLETGGTRGASVVAATGCQRSATQHRAHRSAPHHERIASHRRPWASRCANHASAAQRQRPPARAARSPPRLHCIPRAPPTTRWARSCTGRPQDEARPDAHPHDGSP